MDSGRDWYQSLRKPSWAPPARLFGPVWMALYAVIIVSFGTVFGQAVLGRVPGAIVWPFVVNLAANFAFTPLQFGLRNNMMALADIVIVLISLVWALVAVFPYLPWVAAVNVPYLLWISFAALLQAAITYLNR